MMLSTLLLLSFSVGAGDATAPATTNTPVLLHLDEALREALAAHPSVRQAQAQVQSAEAKAEQARASLLPQLSAAATYERGTANTVDSMGNTRSTQQRTSTGTSWKTYDYYDSNVTLSQLLYDFGGGWDRWHAAQTNVQGQVASQTATRLDTALAVRSAFFNASGALAMLHVAEETFANQKRHLAQIQGYVDVGQRPQIDLAQARTDVANAEVQRILADNTYRTAKVQLNQTLGREGMADFEVADDQLPEVEGESAPAHVLLDEAVRARPEIVAFDYQLQAQEQAVQAIKAGYFPSLGAATSVTYGGTEPSALTWNWSVQANLSWSIFQGGLVRAQAADAAATLAVLTAQRDAERQQISLEVERARLAVNATRATLAAATQALQNANERLALAEARYRAGIGNIIELGDAQLAQNSAAAQQVQAQYTLATARAQLLNALGRP